MDQTIQLSHLEVGEVREVDADLLATLSACALQFSQLGMSILVRLNSGPQIDFLLVSTPTPPQPRPAEERTTVINWDARNCREPSEVLSKERTSASERLLLVVVI